MARISMTSWSDVVNALEQDFSDIGISSISDVFLGEEAYKQDGTYAGFKLEKLI